MARVLHTSVVAPSPSRGERSLPLTYLDAIWLHARPVERVFFYRHRDATGDEFVSRLKDSLAQALSEFYPLAGRLRLVPGTANRHELHYQPGDGVAFTVAEYDDDAGVDELATDGPTEAAKLTLLAPPLPEGGAVLALQATVLRGGGLALGVTVHHAACDGASSTHFLHTWAAAACAGSAPAPEPPVIDRTCIRDREDLHDIFSAARGDDAGDSSKFNRSPGDIERLRLATFTLSMDHLQSIKDAVAREAARCGVTPPPRTSSIVATFGFVWQCYSRARPGGEEPAESSGGRAYFFFPADQRARMEMEPPVPDKYLGNCVVPFFAAAPKKEVAAAGLSGLFTACSAVAAAVDGARRGAGPGYWEGLFELGMEAYSGAEMPLTVAGSPRFRVYNVDFGFGRPVKVDVVSVARTGAISVAEARGGDGGVEVGIALPPDAMDRFRRCFADAVACLSS